MRFGSWAAVLGFGVFGAAAMLAGGCAADPGETAGDPEPVGSTAEALTAGSEMREQARVPGLRAACPASRKDALCAALRGAERAGDPEAAGHAYAAARDIVRSRLEREERGVVISDQATRHYLRERAHALLVHGALFAGQTSPPEDFTERVDELLARRFPLYASASFPAAHAWLPPEPPAPCTGPREVLLIFPGVLRSGTRVEFAAQIEAIERALPCLQAVRVETDSFAPLVENAQVAAETLARLDASEGPRPAPVAVHLLGYSQGVTNALQALVDVPALRARTRSFVALNSAAHGSEAIDALLAAVGLGDDPNARCADLPSFARPACEEIARTSLRPVADWMRTILINLGFSPEQVAGQNLGEFVRLRLGGLESLSSKGTARFWRERGAELPRDIPYLSFRTVISDPLANLPASNALLYGVVSLSSPASPYNDMQVRLQRHALGGPLADAEVVSHAAEGNHWQWELTPQDLPEALIPASMLEGIPRAAMWTAYYQTLYEVGIVLPR